MLKFLHAFLYQSKRISHIYIISLILYGTRGIVSLIILALAAFSFSQPVLGGSDGAYRLRRVVIDPGHGGRDPGAVGRRSKEKDIVLAISLKLGAYINEHSPDVDVMYTRDNDQFIEVHRRAEVANRNNADLFISIHANSNPNRSVRGTDTFVLGLHRTKENLDVAMKENAAILLEDDYDEQYLGFDPNSPESYIIFSLMQNTYLSQSLDFASHVQNQFRERAGRVDRGVRQAGFMVLFQTTMPSVLVEVGFISNEDEERFLMSEQGQSYIASAIFRAFRDYKQTIERKSDLLAATSGSENRSDGSGMERRDNIRTTDQNSDPVVNDTAHDDTANDQAGRVVFKVQVGSSMNRIPLDSEFFNGLKDIEVYEHNGLFKYVIGNAFSLEEIVAFRKAITELFPDAFIVAVQSGTLISLQEALSRN